MRPETWLRRAMRRKTDKPFRPELCEFHKDGEYTVCANGLQLHVMKVDIGARSQQAFPRWQDVFKIDFEGWGHVSRDHLRAAMEAAMAYQNDGKDERPDGPLLGARLTLAPVGFQVHMENPALGRMDAAFLHGQLVDFGKTKTQAVVAQFDYSLMPCEIQVNPAYMVDALWGMDDVVELKVSTKVGRVMLHSEPSPKIDHEMWALIASLV